jgi:hypothetical protein
MPFLLCDFLTLILKLDRNPSDNQIQFKQLVFAFGKKRGKAPLYYVSLDRARDYLKKKYYLNNLI